MADGSMESAIAEPLIFCRNLRRVSINRDFKIGSTVIYLKITDKKKFSHEYSPARVNGIYESRSRASYRISMGCNAFFPVPSLIWCLQLVPGAAMITFSGC